LVLSARNSFALVELLAQQNTSGVPGIQLNLIANRFVL